MKSDFFAQPDETLRGKRRSSYGIKKDKKVAYLSNNGYMAAVLFGKARRRSKFCPYWVLHVWADSLHGGFCMSWGSPVVE